MPADAAPATPRTGAANGARRPAAGPAATGPARWWQVTRKPWWPLASRLLKGGFLLLVAVLLTRQARQVDWPAVAKAFGGYSGTTLLLAVLLAAASYATYSTYDLIGRHQTGHRMRNRDVIGVGLVSYAFNLNLGSLIGGFALRQRLYAHFGLKTEVTARIFALSVLTNWFGYVLLAGTVFLLRPLALPPEWKIDGEGLRLLGVALLLVALGYGVLCLLRTRGRLDAQGRFRHLPSLRIAGWQLAVSTLNWSLIAAILYVMLQQRIDYPTVLAVMLVAAVSGAISHVPAGLGVLEAVFVALLSHRVPPAELLAALLAYRAIYYLGPLALATGLYFVVRSRDRDGAQATAA